MANIAAGTAHIATMSAHHFTVASAAGAMSQNRFCGTSGNPDRFVDRRTRTFSTMSITVATMTAPRIAKLRFLAEFENASIITMKISAQVNRMRK
jgi:hypothetical protein